MEMTAGIIIIGDEILSGKVEECNSLFLSRGLRARGVNVCRICIIPDEVDEIAAEVRGFSDRYDYVFTSGGLGPTHDDVTIEGIAKGFSVRVVVEPHLRSILDRRYGDRVTPERLKMAEVPEGGELITDKALEFPLIRYKNVFIFPGIPQYLRDKFNVIEHMFIAPSILLKRVYVNEYESEIAPMLNDIVRDNKGVKIGSYPIMHNSEHRVMLTIESVDEAALTVAVEALLKGLGAKVAKVD
ncbi:MAG: competence/damage-inducible protein A [Nitrospirae bacterium]|nr:competence/damage-inducible protein A [Nitrospirota bacterium]